MRTKPKYESQNRPRASAALFTSRNSHAIVMHGLKGIPLHIYGLRLIYVYVYTSVLINVNAKVHEKCHMRDEGQSHKRHLELLNDKYI